MRKEERYTFIDGNALDGERDEEVYLGIDSSLSHFSFSVVTADGRYFLWCYTPPAPKMVKGVQTNPLWRGNAQRVAEIDRWLATELMQVKIRGKRVVHVAMEDYAFGAKGQTFRIGELGGVVKQRLLRTYGLECTTSYPTLVSTTQVKKFCLGVSADQGKQLILKGVYKKWGLDLDDDNMADSFVLACIARSLETGVTDYAYEREVIAKLTEHTEWVSPSKTLSRPKS